MNQDDITYIKIPYPKAKDLHFEIKAPICPLVISPGIGTAWATGRFHDPKAVIPLSIRQAGNTAEIMAVGAFAYRTPPKYLPQLTLSFGRTKPFSLAIEAGDISDRMDFGGLPLTSLELRFGCGEQDIDFSYPNPQEMQRLKVTADSGTVVIGNLAHANAAEIRLNGDSISYRLDFGAEIKRSTTLQTGMAVARLEIALPSGTALKIISSSPPHSSTAQDFIHAEKAFWNKAAREQQEPLLTINNIASNAALHLRFI